MSTREDRIGAPEADVTARAQGVAALFRTTLPLAAILAAVVTGLYVYSNATPKLGMSATAPTGMLPSLRDSRPLVETEQAKEAPAAPVSVPPGVTATPPAAPPSDRSQPQTPPEQVLVPRSTEVPASRDLDKALPVEPAPVIEAARTEAVPVPPPAASVSVVATPPPVAPQVAAAQPRAPEGAVGSGGSMLQRGQALLEQGNIAAARLFLERAAAAENAEAALLLGSSFDPKWLRTRGVIGTAADPARARKWYLEAERLGSPEAAGRLSALEVERN